MCDGRPWLSGPVAERRRETRLQLGPELVLNGESAVDMQVQLEENPWSDDMLPELEADADQAKCQSSFQKINLDVTLQQGMTRN